MPRAERNPRLAPIRQSTSQPEGSRNRRELERPRDFDTRSPAYETALPSYDAQHDPYCPYTRTQTFKKHMNGRKRLEKLSKTEGNNKLSKSQSQPFDLTASMKNMDRPLTAPDKELIPRHQVQNQTYETSGVTVSSEPSGNAAEGQAELEVLKAILNREGYLSRLFKSVRTIQKKFKPEVADILDLVRTSTIDVVEAIEKWRRIKVFIQLKCKCLCQYFFV